MTQSEEHGRWWADSTNASTESEKGFPPWALINWETDRKCITYFCVPPPVHRNIELSLFYGLMTLSCFGSLWQSKARCAFTPGSLWECGNDMPKFSINAFFRASASSYFDLDCVPVCVEWKGDLATNNKHYIPVITNKIYPYYWHGHWQFFVKQAESMSTALLALLALYVTTGLSQQSLFGWRSELALRMTTGADWHQARTDGHEVHWQHNTTTGTSV